ncbi:MAG: polysulfide reductase [Chloroflexi bacterium]|nr:MAG: polysulfide reductase [Chloroflexota bacterium]
MPGEHFTVAPHWEWWILGYFFLAGIAGGSYALGTMLRLVGDRRDQPAARVAFLIAFPVLVVCPILLTVDLGQPFRFWHMLIDSSSGVPVFKYWSPMSLGAWALTVFGIFAFVSFVEALVLDGRIRHPLGNRLARALSGIFGRLFLVVGTLLGLFVAGYTGVLLSVSNQPVWSDTWTLCGLFFVSGLSAATAVIGIWVWRRRDARVTTEKLSEADRYFVIMELVLLALFFITLGSVVSKILSGGWLLLWLLVLAGALVPLAVHFRPAWARQVPPLVPAVFALVGVLALRAVIIFSAQS